MSMRTVLVKKVTNATITILIILVANFVLFRLVPGDPAITFIRSGAGHSANPDLVDRQRGKYLVNTFTGNWGYSFFQGDRLVTEIIAEKTVWTVLLVGTSPAITIWLGYVLLILFQEDIGIIPLLPRSHSLPTPYPTDSWTILVEGFRHWILPALTLTLVQLAGISIIMRNSLTDILTEDYILTARAKGLSDRMILKKHAMPNARLPMVTVIALNLGYILGGAIQVEQVFSYDGLGLLTIEAILSQDYPLMQAIFLLLTISVVVANLISDFLYAWLDPRVRLE